MASEELVVAIQSAQDAVTKQADTVRSLKAEVKEGKRDKVIGSCDLIVGAVTASTVPIPRRLRWRPPPRSSRS